MDLLRLLEIDRSLIPPEAQRSLLIAEMTWSAAGSPQDRAGLGASLEKTLQSCTSQGIWYAPVLLQPKKAIERGTWRPLQRAATRPGKQHAERPLERHDERHDGAKAELPQRTEMAARIAAAAALSRLPMAAAARSAPAEPI